jgi:hypothetical protein
MQKLPCAQTQLPHCDCHFFRRMHTYTYTVCALHVNTIHTPCSGTFQLTLPRRLQVLQYSAEVLYVNGLEAFLSTYCLLPSALLMRGNAAGAALEESNLLSVMALSTHPPTQCYVYAILCSEYLPLLGDAQRCLVLCEKAMELAQRLESVCLSHENQSVC